jgi:hypothetical protein
VRQAGQQSEPEVGSREGGGHRQRDVAALAAGLQAGVADPDLGHVHLREGMDPGPVHLPGAQMPSVGASASVRSSRRRNEPEDVTAALSSRARSTSRRSEVTTLRDAGTWSSASIRTIS